MWDEKNNVTVTFCLLTSRTELETEMASAMKRVTARDTHVPDNRYKSVACDRPLRLVQRQNVNLIKIRSYLLSVVKLHFSIFDSGC